MPAKSKRQQHLFGMVHAMKKGELKHPSAKVKEVAENVSDESATHFAETPTKGLPEKKAKMEKGAMAALRGHMGKVAAGNPFTAGETAIPGAKSNEAFYQGKGEPQNPPLKAPAPAPAPAPAKPATPPAANIPNPVKPAAPAPAQAPQTLHSFMPSMTKASIKAMDDIGRDLEQQGGRLNKTNALAALKGHIFKVAYGETTPYNTTVEPLNAHTGQPAPAKNWPAGKGPSSYADKNWPKQAIPGAKSELQDINRLKANINPEGFESSSKIERPGVSYAREAGRPGSLPLKTTPFTPEMINAKLGGMRGKFGGGNAVGVAGAMAAQPVVEGMNYIRDPQTLALKNPVKAYGEAVNERIADAGEPTMANTLKSGARALAQPMATGGALNKQMLGATGDWGKALGDMYKTRNMGLPKQHSESARLDNLLKVAYELIPQPDINSPMAFYKGYMDKTAHEGAAIQGIVLAQSMQVSNEAVGAMLMKMAGEDVLNPDRLGIVSALVGEIRKEAARGDQFFKETGRILGGLDAPGIIRGHLGETVDVGKEQAKIMANKDKLVDTLIPSGVKKGLDIGEFAPQMEGRDMGSHMAELLQLMRRHKGGPDAWLEGQVANKNKLDEARRAVRSRLYGTSV